MVEQSHVGRVLDHAHAEGAEVRDLLLFEDGGSCREDCFMEELCCWEAGFEAFDAGWVLVLRMVGVWWRQGYLLF